MTSPSKQNFTKKVVRLQQVDNRGLNVLPKEMIQKGYIVRTPRGRMATRHAYEHLGLKAPGHHPSSEDLFSDAE